MRLINPAPTAGKGVPCPRRTLGTRRWNGATRGGRRTDYGRAPRPPGKKGVTIPIRFSNLDPRYQRPPVDSGRGATLIFAAKILPEIGADACYVARGPVGVSRVRAKVPRWIRRDGGRFALGPTGCVWRLDLMHTANPLPVGALGSSVVRLCHGGRTNDFRARAVLSPDQCHHHHVEHRKGK